MFKKLALSYIRVELKSKLLIWLDERALVLPDATVKLLESKGVPKFVIHLIEDEYKKSAMSKLDELLSRI